MPAQSVPRWKCGSTGFVDDRWLTVANPRRLEEPDYRREVAESLVEVLFYLDNFFGKGRLYLPPQIS
jgi:hypothetical protein